eukprot:Em0223g3a
MMAVAVGNEPPNVIGEIGILACGRTGIGKSCLLNTLLGTSEDRFAVNGPGGVGDRCMDAGTTGLISVSEIIHGIKVTLYDTPGLESKPGDNYFIDLMEKIDKCGKAVNDIFQNLKKELLKQKVPAEIVDGIPLVAAGNSKKHGLSLLTAEEQAEFRALFLDESLWNDSPSPTDGIPQPPPIVLTARQSNRVFKALAAATGVVLVVPL